MPKGAALALGSLLNPLQGGDTGPSSPLFAQASAPARLVWPVAMEPGAKAVVLKRDGASAPADFDAVTQRNAELCSESYGRPLAHARENLEALTGEVRAQFRTGMTTRELDKLTIAVCAGHSARHRDYSDLAARITVSDLHKTTPPTFVEAARRLGGGGGRLSEEMGEIAERAAEAIEARLDYRLDYSYTHFGIQTMLRSYLLREAEGDRATVERPQHAHMRVALGVRVAQPDRDGHRASEEEFQARLAEAFEVYELLAARRLSHASPTVFNAGTRHPQHSSCYLLRADDDLESLLQVCKDAGMISKWAGGVGIGLSKVRAEGAPIRSTGGASSGLSRYVALLNACQLYVNQGGLRPGAYALYLEPWHADIFSFLELGRVKGHSGANAPDLKYGLWVPDLFMETLQAELEGGDGDWPLFCPDSAPGLDEVHGGEFRALHRRYVREGRQARVVKASEIVTEWFKTVAQRGNPYVLFKDHINAKSNLSHVQTISHSNLCAEITIPSRYEAGRPDEAEYGVCNLAALPLASFLVEGGEGGRALGVDWAALAAAAAAAVRNLDAVIDLNFDPTPACRRSNHRHRPVAVGVAGLADVFARLGLVYGSWGACAIDAAIHATIYYGATQASRELAVRKGAFATFPGSATSRGQLQPDLWVAAGHLAPQWESRLSETTDGFLSQAGWAQLRNEVRKGVRNAYVTADMPTATSSQAAGQNEAFEPFTTNLYTRKTLAGDFAVLNAHLVRELEARGLWTEDLRLALLAAGGSVQEIEAVPADLRRLFRTAREIDQRLLTRHAAARNPFLSQTQSLNYYFGAPVLSEVLPVLMEGWKAGLTTGSYYIHTVPAAGAQNAALLRRPGSGGAAAKSGAEAAEPAPAEPAPACSAREGCEACEACEA